MEYPLPSHNKGAHILIYFISIEYGSVGNHHHSVYDDDDDDDDAPTQLQIPDCNEYRIFLHELLETSQKMKIMYL